MSAAPGHPRPTPGLSRTTILGCGTGPARCLSASLGHVRAVVSGGRTAPDRSIQWQRLERQASQAQVGIPPAPRAAGTASPASPTSRRVRRRIRLRQPPTKASRRWPYRHRQALARRTEPRQESDGSSSLRGGSGQTRPPRVGAAGRSEPRRERRLGTPHGAGLESGRRRSGCCRESDGDGRTTTWTRQTLPR